jgi:VWFA-related protein
MAGFGRWLTLAGLAAAGVSISAQRTSPPEPPTFRTGTSLVTVDAVVLDRDGQHVTDLTLDDFEVVRAGKRQPLRQVVYVPLTGGGALLPTASSMSSVAPAGPGGGDTMTPTVSAPVSTPAPTRRLGPDPLASRARTSSRLIAIVVDDLGLSFESTAYVRRALSSFVDEQVQASDTVAILRTGAGVGALQQFTSDKRLLHAAIDRVRWTILSRSGVSAFSPVVPPNAMGGTGNGGSGTAEASKEDTMEGLRTTMLASGSLAALEYVVRGVEQLPGRKSVVFVSEGFRLLHRPEGYATQGNSRVWKAFTRVMDRANRAGVVVYTMDARGLQTTGLTAEDDPQPVPPPPGGAGGGGGLDVAAQKAILEGQAERHSFLFDSQEALVYMAEQTGGFAILNNNDLARGFGRVLNDLRGYYLLGFESSETKGSAWEAGDIRIRVKRPGLRVRARQGLFGPADPERATDAAPGDPLVMAALSPFVAGALDVRLTALFAHDAKDGSYVRSMFYVDPGGVRFDESVAGRHVAQLTLLLMMVGDNGQIVSQFRRTVDLDLSAEELAQVRQRGILYHARMPLKASGGFQVRAAVRDEKSGQLGSGSQFFEAPLVGKQRLALSGIVMQGEQPKAPFAPSTEGTEAGLAPADSDDALFSEPGIRIFRPGADAVYSCEIYDGATDQALGLATYATLLRDGREVFRSRAAPVARRTSKSALQVVPVAGRLSLGPKMPRGPYTLRVTVAQSRVGKVVRQASQWVEFEVR